MDLVERSHSDQRHPWELARAAFFRRLIAEHADLKRISRVLDVGAGDGWFAHELHSNLSAEAAVVCWDVNYRSEDLATPPGEGILRTVDPPSGHFPLILLLDVLEHIADDRKFLDEEVINRLSPGGILVASVPVYPALFSEHDRMLLHERRYRPDALRRLLHRHLDVVDCGPLFTSLVVLRTAEVLAERAGLKRQARGIGAWRRGPAVTRLVTSVLTADARIGMELARRGLRLPGLSTWVVARRTDTQ
jgi:SAM-dependent methyltransferase